MAEDRNLTCRDCGKTFVFTAGEQAFFSEKGLSDPIRCPDCRRLRKQQRTVDAGPGAAPAASGAPPRYAPRTGDFPSGGGDRTSAPPRSNDFAPRAPRTDGDDDESRKGFRKARPPASVAKFNPPKKEQAAVPKEKRPNNRRNEEKLLLNWKEEVGLDDVEDADWLAADEEE